MNNPLHVLNEEEVRQIAAQGQGGLGSLSTESGPLPLKALDVKACIVGTLAHTTVEQVFFNNFPTPLEATYIFPLPDRAAVTRFTMRVAGRTVEGELQERRQARRAYEQAIEAGKRASIAEEERASVFTLRCGNLM